jgi:hypothetical protein
MGISIPGNSHRTSLIDLRFSWLFLTVLFAIHSVMLAKAAAVHSPTHNEPAHLVAGLFTWQFGRFEVYRVNPPLTRMIAAIPVICAGYEPDWSSFYEGPGARPEFLMGRDFVKLNGPRSIRLLMIARCACIPISLLGCYFVFRFSSALYGIIPGLGAALLWCFTPIILAHAEFVTPDCAATTFGIAATYFFWVWLNTPRWINAITAGIFLAFAQLSKASWVIMFVLWPMLWCFWILTEESSKAKHCEIPQLTRIGRQFIHLSLMLLLAIYLMNAFYGFEGSMSRLGTFQFVSTTLKGLDSPEKSGNRFSGTTFARIPIPLPTNYVRGLDEQWKDLEDFPSPNYLCGEWKEDGGWWYYYFYALAVKTPVGICILLLGAITVRFMRVDSLNRWRDEIILMLPALALLSVASSQTEINAHLRYVLPVIGTLLIFTSRVLLLPMCKTLTPAAARVATSVIAACLLWTVVATVWNYPHQMAYFNELVGGPLNGHRHLLGSNVDWGQSVPLEDRSPSGIGIFIYSNYDVTAINPSLVVVSENELPDLLTAGQFPRNLREVHVPYSAYYKCFPHGSIAHMPEAMGVRVDRLPEKFVCYKTSHYKGD